MNYPLSRIGVSAVIALLVVPFFADAGTHPVWNRSLSFGLRGQDVIELQNILITQGDLAAENNTGYFGRLTEAAVKKFQCRSDIVCSGSPSTTGYGTVGPRTRTKLLEGFGSGGNVSTNFSAYPLSGGAPLSVSFSGSVPVTLFGYNLQYGDGTTTGIECNPGSKSGCTFNFSHIYTNVGTYTVKLTEAAKPPVGTLATVAITVTSEKSVLTPRNITVTLTSDKTSVSNGEKIRFTSTITNNSWTEPLAFNDEKSGQCQSSFFSFSFDGKSSTEFFLAPGGWFSVPGVCSNLPATTITLSPRQSYSVHYDAKIPPVGNNESLPPYAKNIPLGNHVVNVNARLLQTGAGVFWEGNSNTVNFTVQ